MKSLRFAAAALLLFLFHSCGTGGSAKGTGPLPAPQGEPKASPYQPPQAYEVISPGVSSRTLHSASTGTGYRVELRELIVGPGKRGATIDLKGAALLEVLSGAGSLTCPDKRQDLKPGVTLSIPPQVCTVDNTSEVQLSFRAYVFTGE
jgi:mannose-6-phosphate isomerase-like protein (cupin superfamily)